MSVLQACPSCARPYDVERLEPRTPLRCLCGARSRVEASPRSRPGRACGHCGAPAPPGTEACAHCGIALDSKICPRCLARSPREARHCVGCGAELVCRGLRPLPEEASCPRCRGELGLRADDELGSLVECIACAGIWIEPADFDRLCRRVERDGTANECEPAAGYGPEPYVPCIVCGELMVRRAFQWRGRSSRVVLDHCRNHGVWLDADELGRVAAFVIRAVQQGPAPPEIVSPVRLTEDLPPLRRLPRSPFDLLVSWIETGLQSLLGD